MGYLVLVGNYIHSISLNSIEFLKKYAFLINEDEGIIVDMIQLDKDTFFAPDKIKEILNSKSYVNFEIQILPLDSFVIPGLIDTHTHAPQFSNIGTGTELSLLQWLSKYTFPEEAKFSSLAHSEKVYNRLVFNTLRNGTTTCCYYGSIHVDATKVLVDCVKKHNQRALVGKVNMDQNSPEFYVEKSTKISLDDTRDFICYVLNGDNGMISPVVTPRFVPTCSPELLHGLSSLAKEYNVRIQSHLSENLDEILWVKNLFPSKSYAQVYDEFELLNSKTIMAHCIHLSPDEIKILKTNDVGVAHCPNSNFSLCSGVCNVRQLLNESIKVGLGTDMSGGTSPSIMDAMRQAIIASKVIASQNPETNPLSPKEAFYLATLGGAQVINLENLVGNFQIGKKFDALEINFSNESSLTKDFNDEELFDKFIYLGNSNNIVKIWVNGKPVCDYQE